MTTITKVQKEKKHEFEKNLTRMEGEITKGLPKGLSTQVMMRVVLTAVTQTPKLLECTQASLFGSILKAAQLGLMPDGLLGEAYLIPYGTQCNFQIGYKGMIQLIRRVGNVRSIIAREVYKGDDFSYDLNDSIHFHRRNNKTDYNTITHVYAIIRYKEKDVYDFDVMAKAEVEAHMKRYSKAWKKSDSPWQTAFNTMAKKTVLLRCAKYAQLSTEVQSAISLDETAEAMTQRNAGNLVNTPMEDQGHQDIQTIEITEEKEETKQKVKESAQKAETAVEDLKDGLFPEA